MAVKLCALAAVVAGILFGPPQAQGSGGGANVITTPDPVELRSNTSLALNHLGNPVVAYSDGDLKVLICGEPTCGSGSVIATPDTEILDGGPNNTWVSLAIDGAGNPVVAYFYVPTLDLRVLHCGDPTCTSNNTVTAPDTTGFVGYQPSLTLDSLGNPVVAYRRVTGEPTLEGLKILHCGDPACSSGNTLTSPVTGLSLGFLPSLALDSSGNPVISYSAEDGRWLLRCGDPACSSANVLTAIDKFDPEWPGNHSSSLALDASDHPVVAYAAPNRGPLRLLHCGDTTCSSGNSVVSVDSPGLSWETTPPLFVYPSLELDGSGSPVVSSFVSYPNDGVELRVLHCTDPNCASGLTIVVVDRFGYRRGVSSLGFDTDGNPVVSYAEVNGLHAVHCATPTCVDPKADPDGDSIPNGSDTDDDGDGCADTRELGPNAAQGGQRNAYSVWDFFDTPDASNLRDGVVNVADISRVVARFGQSGSRFTDPLTSPPSAPAYHTAFDRTPGPAPWRADLANGSISTQDISLVVTQFGHSCI